MTDDDKKRFLQGALDEIKRVAEHALTAIELGAYAKDDAETFLTALNDALAAMEATKTYFSEDAAVQAALEARSDLSRVQKIVEYQRYLSRRFA